MIGKVRHQRNTQRCFGQRASCGSFVVDDFVSSAAMESLGDLHMIARNTIRPVMIIFMLCCVIGFPSGLASADPGSPADLIGNSKSARDKGAIFNLLDENGDQRVDRAEFSLRRVSSVAK